MGGVAARLKGARAAGGDRNYFKEGNHVARLDSFKFDETRKRIEMFATDFTVMLTDSEHPRMQPGRTVNYACLVTNDMYDSNLKSLMCAIFRMTEDEYDATDDKVLDKMIEDLSGKEQKYAGTCIEVTCPVGEDDRVFPRFSKMSLEDEALAKQEFAKSVQAKAAKAAQAAAQ